MSVEDVDHEQLIRLRQEGAVRVCERIGVDALLATQHDNVQYIADVRRFFVYGWEPNSLAVITREGAVKSVDCGYHVAPGPHWANEGAWLKEQTGWDHFSVFNASLVQGRYAAWVKDALAQLGVKRGRVGVDRVSWVILEELRSVLPEIEFVNAEEPLLFERIVKNEEERKLMRAAAKVASEGVQAGLDALAPGVTEYEVYGAFMGRMYTLGSEGDGFYPFLASGAVTEGTLYPTNRVLAEGDAIVMDMGPIVEGYNGDCMRTGFIGEPTPEFKELYRVNYEAMYAGIETIRPGIRISEVDAAVRRTALAHGYMENRFDTGHGIGLNCCELPVCMKAGTAPDHLDVVLEPGMCFTLEPRFHRMIGDGTYIQAALEETVMVSETGVEVLTTTPFIEECLA
ncbi:MAG: aminopeptidase P family protein [Thermoleophilia bacterium]|nr:aminopeptidase P family protein [Thermoleophilia bacterium]